METESGLTYYDELPPGYVKITTFKELFTLPVGETVLSIDNAIIREGIEFILYNPQTKQYYPRYLTVGFDRKRYNEYISDGNLYIKETDLIWSKK